MAKDFECNLCGSKKASKVPFRYLFKERYLWLYQCDSCKLRSIWPLPTSQEIEEMYAADYFTEANSATHHMDTDYLALLNNGDYADGIENMKKYCQEGSILEIGCATGNFLNALKNVGYTVKGIELSTFAVEYAKNNFGLNLINKPFDRDLLNNDIFENEFDVVIMEIGRAHV